MALKSCSDVQLHTLADEGQEEEEEQQAVDQGQLQAWDLLSCHVVCMVATSACELGIPDLLAESPGGLTAQQIADKLGRQAPRHAAELERIMRLLCAKGVFACHVDEGRLRYELAPASTWLRSHQAGGQLSVSPFLLLEMSLERLAPWRHLARYILEGGSTPFEAAHGHDMGVYAYTRAHPEFGRVFHAAMACSTDISLAAFLEHYNGFDSEDVRVLVDVAGGVGTAVARIVTRHPHIKGVNYDLPHVVAAAPLLQGVEHVGGDMFESVPSADAIFMKWVLPNWEDENCIKLLQNCRKALHKGGKLILLDPIIDLNIMKKQVSILNTNRMAFDVAMIAQTKGKARTRDEMNKLLQVSGFQQTKFFEIPCQECIVEAS